MFTNVNRLPVSNSSRWTMSVPTVFAGAQREMDRLFEALFEGGDNADGRGWWAPWASWEDDAHLHLELELPGVAKDDLELVTHQGKLLVRCQRKAPEEGKQFRFNTRRYGEFERVISLPDTIDTDAIQAELRDGVLQVTLNKRAEVQPKRINVGG
ncbi:MAG TPA: Hsp20/alpha crystallin family protein [Pirellulales bacterium]|nr:Hsp20/alpha crystallin family protein [Pirellulales bacterium]